MDLSDDDSQEGQTQRRDTLTTLQALEEVEEESFQRKDEEEAEEEEEGLSHHLTRNSLRHKVPLKTKSFRFNKLSAPRSLPQPPQHRSSPTTQPAFEEVEE